MFIGASFTTVACFISGIFLMAGFFVRPSESDCGQHLSHSEDEDKTPKIGFSDYKLPALLSDRDGEDDAIES